MDGVKLVNSDPSVRIEFTVAEYRGLLDVVVGAGLMDGAWDKIREGRELLKGVGIEGLPR